MLLSIIVKARIQNTLKHNPSYLPAMDAGPYANYLNGPVDYRRWVIPFVFIVHSFVLSVSWLIGGYIALLVL